MKSTLGSYRFRCLILALALSPAALLGQKREEILSIQRDVAQLQEQVRQLQEAQDQKLGALENLVQQTLGNAGRASSSMTALQRSLTDRLNQQQALVEAPVAVLGTKVDQSADEIRTVRESLTDLARRLANLDNKLADISSAVRTFNAPAAAPPPAASEAGAAPAAAARSTTPGGASADSLWQKAARDYSSGKDEAALNEFAEYLKYFPQSGNAAEAQYSMGLIYDHGKQYDDAGQAFNAVVQRYPDSPKAADAMYMKGVEYQKAGNDTEAMAAYRAFLRKYPSHADAAKAQARLRTLGTGRARAGKKRK